MKYIYLTGLLLSFSISITALAATTVETSKQVDVTGIVKDEDGSPLKDPFILTGDKPILTVRLAIAHALNVNFNEDHNWEQKWARSILADRVKNSITISFDADEVLTIEDRLGKVYGGVVLSQIIPLIDPAKEPPKVKKE